MSNFLKLLDLELKQIEEKDFIQPKIRLNLSEEEVIGEMSDFTRRLFTKKERLQQEALEYMGSYLLPSLVELAKASGTPKHEEAFDTAIEGASKGNELRDKLQLIEDLLWITIKDEFSLWSPEVAVGVREGFKVVTRKEE